VRPPWKRAHRVCNALVRLGEIAYASEPRVLRPHDSSPSVWGSPGRAVFDLPLILLALGSRRMMPANLGRPRITSTALGQPRSW
jgi:hypothetical protein